MPHATFRCPSSRSTAIPSRLLRLAMVGLLMLIVGCSSADTRTSSPVLTIVVVRHAEKGSDDARDPSLSEAGHARAHHLAVAMSRTPPDAVYASQFRRTLQTAQPSALAFGLPVLRYEAQLPAAALAGQLRGAHAGGAILIVGHSNTVPDIVAALSGKNVPPMPEEEYGVLYRIDIGPGDDVALERSSF